MANIIFRLAKGNLRRGKWRSQQHLRLHLGCGKEHLEGYVNIDSSPTAHADLYIDFKNIRHIFAPLCVAEVVMIHSLSYLNLWQARDLFADLHLLLENGGKLIIELPDIGHCAQRLLGSGQSEADYLEGVRGFYAFGLDQINRRETYTPYAFGWSGWHLRLELERARFRDVKILQPQTHERTWRDIRVEAMKV